ncbi:glycoside hydrolase family 25 protein [Spirillospora sp. NPDC050679]
MNKRLTTLLSTVLVAGGATAGIAALAPVASAAPAPAVSAAQPADRFQGVDVSTYDRNFDWGRGGLAFGIAKATEGPARTDPTFAANWTKIRDNRLVRGAYHYGHPGGDPVKEADHFVDVVRKGGLQNGDLLMLDLETTDGRSRDQVNAWAKRWLERVESATGVKPFFYSSWYFAQENGDGLGAYPLWVAHYGKDAGRLKAPAPWKDWTLHQYASTDHDHNVSRLAPDELRKLGYDTAMDPAGGAA